MLSFRCYGLDQKGRIVAAENVEANDTDGAIDLGWQFIAAHKLALNEGDALHQANHSSHLGLEIWQGATRVFTTFKALPQMIPAPATQVDHPPV